MSITRRNLLQGTAACVGAATLASVGGTMATAEEPDARASFEIAPEPIADDQVAETVEADVVVVGCGHSGLCTALSAAEAGASVVLFSASSKPISRGGSNHAFSSKYLDSIGRSKPYEGIIGDWFKKEMLTASYRLDMRKWYKIYNNSEEAMNWLIDKMEDAEGVVLGLENVDDNPDLGVMVSVLGAHDWYNEDYAMGQGQPLVVNHLAEKCLDAGVRIDFNTVAKQLVRGGVANGTEGRVDAVIAQDADGNYIKYVGTKGIVLATGDFSGDREMMERYCPDALPVLIEREPSYDYEFQFGGLFPGDGQKMGLWIGAAWQKYDRCAPMFCMGGALSDFFGSPLQGLVMDRNGERIGNEDMINGLACQQMLRMPGGRYFGIWGSNAAESRNGADSIAQWDMYVDSGMAVKGDTIEEVVAALELPEAAIATIERYNELCEAGYDADYHKRAALLEPIAEPPFYGSWGAIDFLTVMGGLRTDSMMRVCDADDQPIEGLYNVGVMAGDCYSNLYSFFTPGFNYGGLCLTMGYLTGRHIAGLE